MPFAAIVLIFDFPSWTYPCFFTSKLILFSTITHFNQYREEGTIDIFLSLVVNFISSYKRIDISIVSPQLTLSIGFWKLTLRKTTCNKAICFLINIIIENDNKGKDVIQRAVHSFS